MEREFRIRLIQTSGKQIKRGNQMFCEFKSRVLDQSQNKLKIETLRKDSDLRKTTLIKACKRLVSSKRECMSFHYKDTNGTSMCFWCSLYNPHMSFWHNGFGEPMEF